MTESRHDRGEVSTETVLVVPVLILLVFLVVQAGVTMHAANVAHHVATAGAMAGARLGGSETYAATVVGVQTSSFGSTLARPPEITMTPRHVVVRVSLRVPRTVPFFAPEVHREVTVSRERYVAYVDR